MKADRIKLYLDEDVDVLIATVLCSRGFDCLTTTGAGNAESSDREQLQLATNMNRTIVTHNRVDYERLAVERYERSESHAGIIVARKRLPYDIVERLLPILNDRCSSDMIDQILYV